MFVSDDKIENLFLYNVFCVYILTPSQPGPVNSAKLDRDS